jgi:hypothetical protein
LLLRWVETNPNSIIEREVNALAQDEEGFTPLVRKSTIKSNNSRLAEHAILIQFKERRLK